MNTLKFAPYDAFVTEQHNVETATTKILNINGKDYKFYEPCNLNVFITNACPNKCFFCINRKNTWTEISNDEIYFHNLEESLKLLQGLHVEATITGGEPTLNYDRFVRTIELLKKYRVKERTVSTTGWNLISSNNKPHLLRKLQELDYIHNISISRMSCNEEINNKILGNTNISNDDLRRIGLYSKINGIETRISCNLIKDSVHTLNDVLEFVDFQETNNISSCLFRELEQTPDMVRVDSLFREIEKKESFKFLENVKSTFYDIDYYKYTSEKTGLVYIVKCYTGHKPTNSSIGSLSYNSGVLRLGFTGDILYGHN